MDREAWWASVYGVAQSRTQLKRLSSSSSSFQNFKIMNFYYLTTQIVVYYGNTSLKYIFHVEFILIILRLRYIILFTKELPYVNVSLQL